jgi:hypothetical protein
MNGYRRFKFGGKDIIETQNELEESIDEYYDTADTEEEQDPRFIRATALTILKEDTENGSHASVEFGSTLILFLCILEDQLRAEFEERIAQLRRDAGLPLETEDDIVLH